MSNVVLRRLGGRSEAAHHINTRMWCQIGKGSHIVLDQWE